MTLGTSPSVSLRRWRASGCEGGAAIFPPQPLHQRRLREPPDSAEEAAGDSWWRRGRGAVSGGRWGRADTSPPWLSTSAALRRPGRHLCSPSGAAAIFVCPAERRERGRWAVGVASPSPAPRGRARRAGSHDRGPCAAGANMAAAAGAGAAALGAARV